MSNRGHVDLGTPRLRRRHGLARKLLVRSAIAATVARCVAVEIWFLVDDSDLAGLPQHTPQLALPAALPPELRALMTAREAARVASSQSAASLQPTARREGQQADSGTPLAQTKARPGFRRRPGSRRRSSTRFRDPSRLPSRDRGRSQRWSRNPLRCRIRHRSRQGNRHRLWRRSRSRPRHRIQLRSRDRQPRAIATAESTWIARLGPALESPQINQAGPHLGKAADRAGLRLQRAIPEPRRTANAVRRSASHRSQRNFRPQRPVLQG
jgi:hypothetical protein